jgi:hypothetical protein
MLFVPATLLAAGRSMDVPDATVSSIENSAFWEICALSFEVWFVTTARRRRARPSETFSQRLSCYSGGRPKGRPLCGGLAGAETFVGTSCWNRRARRIYARGPKGRQHDPATDRNGKPYAAFCLANPWILAPFLSPPTILFGNLSAGEDSSRWRQRKD